MQEETLLTSPLPGSGYLPVSIYPNLDDNNNNPEGEGNPIPINDVPKII